jgi:hypothetical protein
MVMKRLQKSVAAWQFVEWTEHLTNQRGREKKAFEEPGHWCTRIVYGIADP